jgi:hypothetical protein
MELQCDLLLPTFGHPYHMIWKSEKGSEKNEMMNNSILMKDSDRTSV